ncbi:hypothetical protein BDV24DRAFT_153152 [Aspergillus arachidicola]|uniref:Oxidoreductase n=1 Tax=Aspergillus arachidicola TaxID=656916 RepID=A0A5N6Y0A3_9EURO|nr:hypothetical protein BDV24DRAFT_153152 [Aspergillus arachidicola]
MLSGTQLDGVALVVGSGRGIGQQEAFSIAEAGARVIVFGDLNEENAKASAEESKEYASNKSYEATYFHVNVTDEKGVQAMVDFVERFGSLDYAVNAAGVDNGVHTPGAEIDIENYDRIMNINAKGTMLCVRAEAAAMRKQTSKTFTSRNGTRDIGRGAIVIITSATSFARLPGKGCYTISKHAVMAICKMAGLGHAAEGVRCNANPKISGMINAIYPIKRAAECKEVEDTVVCLLSPSASYITGTSLIIDTGITTTVHLF